MTVQPNQDAIYQLLQDAADEVKRLGRGYDALHDLAAAEPDTLAGDPRRAFITRKGHVRWNLLAEFVRRMTDPTEREREPYDLLREVGQAHLEDADSLAGVPVLARLEAYLAQQAAQPEPQPEPTRYVKSSTLPAGTRVRVHPDGCDTDKAVALVSDHPGFHGGLEGVLDERGRIVRDDQGGVSCAGGLVEVLDPPQEPAETVQGYSLEDFPLGAHVRVVACTHGVPLPAHEGLEGTVGRNAITGDLLIEGGDLFPNHAHLVVPIPQPLDGSLPADTRVTVVTCPHGTAGHEGQRGRVTARLGGRYVTWPGSMCGSHGRIRTGTVQVIPAGAPHAHPDTPTHG